MVSIILAIITLSVIVYRCYKYMFEHPDNFPPGPPKIPIFGSYYFLLPFNYNHMHRATNIVARWYGTSILGFHFGSTPTLAVHDLDTTKEVLNNPDLDGRVIFPLVEARDPLFNVWGIFFKDGLFWQNQRRFTMRHLRDFGFGRRFEELEIHIDEELRAFVDLIKNGAKYDYEKKLMTEDGLIAVPQIFTGHPVNLFLKCMVNERFGRKELGSVFTVAEAIFRFQRTGCMYGRIFSMMESLKYIFPNWSGYKIIRSSAMEIYSFVNMFVKQQYASFDPAHERHFLDLYFKHVREEKEDFTIDQITHTMMEFIVPSVSILSSTLTFLLQRLIRNPDYMAKCQRQIDEVVGNGRLATLDDRSNLSFVEAALRESMRIDTVVANNASHRATQDTKVGGYNLPKGGLVITVLQMANTDAKHFKDPETFRPERFLSVNDKLNLKLDKSVPFGAGRRLCPGETFSRNILFLFACAILQHFNVTVPDGHFLPSAEHQTTGIIKTPANSYLKFTSR